MANNYTGIYAEALTMGDFDTTQFHGVAVAVGVPVSVSYRVLPGNLVAFGNGSNSLNGVRTARVMQLAPKDNHTTPTLVPCKFRLKYEDANRVRQQVIRSDLTANVSGSVGTPNQFNYLAETAQRVGAYAYLTIEFTPLSVPNAGKTFSKTDSEIYLPVTRYTLATASGN